jgi:hypothetical protein
MWSVGGHAAKVVAVSPRKKTHDIIDVLHGLLEHDTAGDPMTGLRWSRRTPSESPRSFTNSESVSVRIQSRVCSIRWAIRYA